MSHHPDPPPLPRDWFLHRPAYRRYALREASALFIAFAGLDLTAAAVALARGSAPFAGWWAAHRHPAAAGLAAVTLGMVMVHSFTWLRLMRLAIPPRRVWGRLLWPAQQRPAPTHIEPLRWGVFTAGGMAAALVLPPAIVLLVLLPAGQLPFDAATLDGAARTWPGRLILALAAPLLQWHGAHRVYHGLHDLQLHGGVLATLGTYGVAAGMSLVTWAALLAS